MSVNESSHASRPALPGQINIQVALNFAASRTRPLLSTKGPLAAGSNYRFFVGLHHCSDSVVRSCAVRLAWAVPYTRSQPRTLASVFVSRSYFGHEQLGAR